MSRLFGYDFWFKNRTPRNPLGRSRILFGGRHPYRNLYRLIACMILLVYLLISSNNTMKEFNESMKTAMIEAGELPAEEQTKQDGSTLDADDRFINRISGLGFGNIIKKNSKIVIYRRGNKNIEVYKDSPAWNAKFAFAEFSSVAAKSNKTFEKYCGEICIIDKQNKKYHSIRKEKANDEKYIYEIMSKYYN